MKVIVKHDGSCSYGGIDKGARSAAPKADKAVHLIAKMKTEQTLPGFTVTKAVLALAYFALRQGGRE
jgi:hypothetical protein